MLLSSTHRLAFVHAPKTGGSSITAALVPHLRAKRPGGPAIGEHGWQPNYHAARMHDRCEDEWREAHAEWTVAVFVRDPWDLSVSLWSFLRKDDEGLASFWRRWLSDPGSINTDGHYYLNPRHGLRGLSWFAQHADFVGRFERLEDDFHSMCGAVGLPPVKLGHQNASSPRAHFSTYHDAESVDVVGSIWREDVDRFGYTPPAIEDVA